jgi:hypothetical protein
MDNAEAAALLKDILGSIDDGGWRALRPLCDDFILAPDGRFVGE